ncbi:MAG: AAA family ATPase, partial [Clostridia bacterium]|nr:AAA family ATPase [Clostridia bacterium]
ALNVMADALGLQRDSVYNRSAFFSSYARLCFASLRQPLPEASRIITSDDVFDYMLNLRTLNEGIDARREDLLEQYWHDRRSEFKLNSIEDYEALKAVNLSKSKTPSKYLKARLMQNVRTQSNGESASFYFIHRIQDGALYLLDEPENSLSPSRQIELAEYIERQARFFGCQFVIATHSPFMLAMKGAVVYDMESAPARVRPWTQLPAMRQTFELFMRHRDAFEQAD